MLVIYWFYVGSMLVIQLYAGLSHYIPTKFEFLLGEDPPSYPSTWIAEDLTGWSRRLLFFPVKKQHGTPSPGTQKRFRTSEKIILRMAATVDVLPYCNEIRIGNLLLGWSWSVFHQISIIPAGWFHQPQVVPPIIMGASAMAWVDPEFGRTVPKNSVNIWGQPFQEQVLVDLKSIQFWLVNPIICCAYIHIYIML